MLSFNTVPEVLWLAWVQAMPKFPLDVSADEANASVVPAFPRLFGDKGLAAHGHLPLDRGDRRNAAVIHEVGRRCLPRGGRRRRLRCEVPFETVCRMPAHWPPNTIWKYPPGTGVLGFVVPFTQVTVIWPCIPPRRGLPWPAIATQSASGLPCSASTSRCPDISPASQCSCPSDHTSCPAYMSCRRWSA